jgi:TM2 domain-containing membrane protein YozV
MKVQLGKVTNFKVIISEERGNMMSGQGSGGNVLAAVCSFFIPGLGQLVQGRLLPAFLFFVVVGIGYFFAVLIIPAVIGGLIHLWSIIDAARFVGPA